MKTKHFIILILSCTALFVLLVIGFINQDFPLGASAFAAATLAVLTGWYVWYYLKHQSKGLTKSEKLYPHLHVIRDE